ncbi:MAG TPA: hypothetical protein PKN76_10335 [bacterium]|nr:hypothetical protein [bacterium]
MRKFLMVLLLVFSVNFLFSDVPANIYELWLETTEKPEKVNIGVYTSTYYDLKPGCENCEEWDTNEEKEECIKRGCENPYETTYVSKVAGEVYRGKFDDAEKLTEVVKIYFDDYFDECVPPGYYEYIVYDNFLFDLCEHVECSNFAGITIPEHSEACPVQDKVEMTQEEFESMKYPFSDEDLESNDYENNDVKNDDVDNNDDSATDDSYINDDVEIYDNDTVNEQNDENESTVDINNKPETSDTSNKTDSDGCSLTKI